MTTNKKDLSINPEELIRLDPELHFRTYARIKDKRGKTVAPKPNVMQAKMLDYYRKQQIAQEPTMLVNLKPRQRGSSTLSTYLCYYHAQRYGNLEGTMAGHIKGASTNMMNLFRRYAENDQFAWRPGQGNIEEGQNLVDDITLTNGTHVGMLTAGSTTMGRSGTNQFATLTEVAFWERSEATKADPALAFINSAFLEGPETLIVMESTPNGASGFFYRTCMDAMNGKGTWHFTFTPWYEFEDCRRLFVTDEQREEFEHELRDDEHEEKERFGVDMEQLHWRRGIIDDQCQGDIMKFRQEFPSDALECFLLSSRPRFNMIVVDNLLKGAIEPRVGTTTIQENGKAVFTPDPGGLWQMFEYPREKCSYIIGVDTATGEDQTTQSQLAPDPDYHSVQVWREAYKDNEDVKHIHKLVALHHSRCDIAILAEEVAAISYLYGDPIVIPEVNNSGLALLKFLQGFYNVRLYQRKKVNESTGFYEKNFGWMTDRNTRKTIIDNLAGLILEEEVDIPSKTVLEELKTFVVNRKGRPEATAGTHDDHVLAAAIALYNINLANEIKPKRRNSLSYTQQKSNRPVSTEDGFLNKELDQVQKHNKRKSTRGKKISRFQ